MGEKVKEEVDRQHWRDEGKERKGEYEYDQVVIKQLGKGESNGRLRGTPIPISLITVRSKILQITLRD